MLVVIVDDDSTEHFLIKKVIKNSAVKCETTSIYNGLQLMDFLLRREAYKNITEIPDVVFLDLTMPMLGGFEVLQQIAEYDFLKSIPVYVMSASSDPEFKRKSLILGAAGYIEKPVDFTELSLVIESILKQHAR